MPLATSHESYGSPGRQLSVGLAMSSAGIGAAQRLRYRVFAGDLGARMDGRAAGRDEDIFAAGDDSAGDPIFTAADPFAFLEVARMENRYARHYLRRAA